jgi:uncharacterized membrane protein
VTGRPWISWARLAFATGVIHFLLIAAVALSRHWTYLTSINDLGIFDQAVWGILNGAPFLNTNNPFGLPINWLGYHFNPILLAVAPFYLLCPAAEWLIVFQAAAISIAAWPLYLIARRVAQSERAAFLWVLVYLLNPFVLNAAVWDFHPVSLAAPLMAVGMLAIEKRQLWLLGVACLFLLLVQEHYGIAVAGFGVLWWLRNKSLVPGLFILSLGVVHVVLVFGVIMPALSPTGGHIMMSGDLGQLSRYGWLGSSPWEIFLSVLSNPFQLAGEIMFDQRGLKYLALLLIPLLATPLAVPEFLLPGLADLVANLLTSNPMPRGLFTYHSISLIPVLVVAGIHGSRCMASKWRFASITGLAKSVCGASVVLAYFTAPLPFPYAQNRWQPAEWAIGPEKALAEVRKWVPPDVSVSAQGNVGAQLSHRYHLYAFPTKVNEADAVVLRLASPTMRVVERNPAAIGSLGHHLLMPPADYLAAVQNILDQDVYGVAHWDPPWLVLAKTGDPDPAARQSVRLYLEQMKRAWHVGDPAAGQE